MFAMLPYVVGDGLGDYALSVMRFRDKWRYRSPLPGDSGPLARRLTSERLLRGEWHAPASLQPGQRVGTWPAFRLARSELG